jgi:hypothetical protein
MMHLLRLNDDCLLRILNLMHPTSRESTFTGVCACRYLAKLFREPLHKLRSAHAELMKLLNKMGTTLVAVEAADRLEWKSYGCSPDIDGTDCSVLANSMQSKFLPKLRSVNLAHNVAMGDIGVIEIVRCATAAKNFNSLNLHRCGFGSPGASGITIAAFDGSLSVMTTLILDHNSICNAGAVDLASACRHMPKLQKLFLNQNVLGDDAAKAIAAAVMQGDMPEIKQLRLDHNNICDAGAQALCDMLNATGSLPNLEVFTLHANILSVDMYENLYDCGRMNAGVWDDHPTRDNYLDYLRLWPDERRCLG